MCGCRRAPRYDLAQPPNSDLQVSRSGQWQAALDLLAQMRRLGLVPGVEAYSAAVTACGEAGRPEEALRLLAEMKHSAEQSGSRGTAPNEITYNAAITACAKAYQVCPYFELV